MTKRLLLLVAILLGVLTFSTSRADAAATCLNTPTCAHWYRYTNVAQMKFLDHTSSWWPISAAAQTWAYETNNFRSWCNVVSQ